jgi:hypothetical protein
VRAARFGLPLMLAIIAGRPERFAPYVELHKRALEIQWPYYNKQFEQAARERGRRPPTYEQFLA